MKSIRKDDVRITAEQLGVSVGDKFVVLSPEDSYNGFKHDRRVEVGDILVLSEDDGTKLPFFKHANIESNYSFCESFSCLAKYDDIRNSTTHKTTKIFTVMKNGLFMNASDYGVKLVDNVLKAVDITDLVIWYREAVEEHQPHYPNILKHVEDKYHCDLTGCEVKEVEVEYRVL